MGIPKDYSEAARMDGASWWRVFFTLYIPMAKSAVISAALILFLFQWESFLWPLIAAGGSDIQVIQVAIANLSEETFVSWNQIFAASVVAIIIPVVLMMPMHRYYVEGVTGAGIKG